MVLLCHLLGVEQVVVCLRKVMVEIGIDSSYVTCGMYTMPDIFIRHVWSVTIGNNRVAEHATIRHHLMVHENATHLHQGGCGQLFPLAAVAHKGHIFGHHGQGAHQQDGNHNYPAHHLCMSVFSNHHCSEF